MKKMSIILHSGDFDKAYSALILGNGALAMGHEVTIFFTFWGLNLLKKGRLDKGSLSKKHFLGLGKLFIKKKMKKQNVANLYKLMNDYRDLGGKIIACDMTMDVMGLKKEQLNMDLIDIYGGVGVYMNTAIDANINLFI